MDTKIIQILKKRMASKQKTLENYKNRIIHDLDTIDTRVFESNMASLMVECAKIKSEIDEDEFLINIMEHSN